MSNSIRRNVAAAVIACSCLTVALPALAVWSHDPEVNNPVGLDPVDATVPALAADGAGGTLFAWAEARGGTIDVYVQRLDADGEPVWTLDGLRAFTGYNAFAKVQIVADGFGGAFLAIQDSHDGAFYHIYLQHVTASGTVTGPNQGTLVAPAIGSAAGQENPSLVNTAPGLAAVVYSQNGDILAQACDTATNLLWGGNGRVVCNSTGSQTYPVATTDGAGGMFAFWQDQRNGGTTGVDVYGQRLGTDGLSQWAHNGNLISNALDSQYALATAADGQGGAYVVWQDGRNNGTTGFDVYGQHVTATGTMRFVANGRAICTVAGNQFGPAVAADGYGGAFCAWTDDRADAYSGSGIYVQYLDGTGGLAFAFDGVPAAPSNGTQSSPQVVATTDDLLCVVWEDARSGWNVYGQLMSRTGVRLWDDTGTVIASGTGNQQGPRVVADAVGGVVAGWWDTRSSLLLDIYAQRVDRSGFLGTPAPQLTDLVDLPQDQGGVVRLTWSASWLDAFGQPGVNAYYVFNRLGSTAKHAAAPDKAAVDALASRTGLSADHALTLLASGWALVGQAAPFWLDAYAFDAPTLADSTGPGTPLTEFKVLASAGGEYFESNILGGYSVDNLAPGAPLFLNAALAGADAALYWTPSGQDDGDLAHYNVYRSATPGFVPGPGNLLGTAGGTSYLDADLPGGAWYYLVAAVDVHGNEGGPSNEANVMSVSAVEDGGVPTALVLAEARPNPFNPSTRIRYDVPRAGPVRLAIYDLAGRQVRTLLDGPASPGRHTATWDGRDDTGRHLASGVYVARLVAGAETSGLKLVLAK